jgi:sec-independent protein translocase protein TatB
VLGLTFEKLLLVAIVAGVLIGPQRLPHSAHELARLVRSLRDVVETARERAEQDTGVSLQRSEWDLSQYDPRRIVRDAMREPSVVRDDPADRASRVRPGQRYVVTGSVAHPRRVPIDSLPVDDPRRVAAGEGPRGDCLPGGQPGTTPT